ncbi:MAG: histidinol-phosphate transaminase [Candidatus Wallbacteria bacterium]|nr:histidinol-phosphate transaminase [Candidatus Wallbacteria bacterium]
MRAAEETKLAGGERPRKVAKSDFAPTAKPHLESLRPYSPGKPAAEVERELGLTDVLKLASNENALGMSPLARAALESALEDSSIYPDTHCRQLVDEIARRNGLGPECVMFGNGAVELIYYLAQCFLAAGDEVVTSGTSFSAYTIASRIQDAVVRAAPLDGAGLDLGAMSRLVNEHTKLVFIANPNNPTGTILGVDELEAFARTLPEQVVLVLDEAYYDFVDDPRYRGSVSFVLEGWNVVVLRSLSKSLGLAGLRIGYAMARSDIIRTMRQVQVPFHVNVLAQRAALAGLDDDEHIARTLQLIREGKEYLYAALAAAGLQFTASETNFIWVDTGVDAARLFDEMMRGGVIVRPGTGFGAPRHIRVTIGLPEQNRRFMQVLLASITRVKP